jgi:hypothetical protein
MSTTRHWALPANVGRTALRTWPLQGSRLFGLDRHHKPRCRQATVANLLWRSSRSAIMAASYAPANGAAAAALTALRLAAEGNSEPT